MRMSEAFPSKFISAPDLKGHTPTVIISQVVMDDIGDTQQKPVMYFQGAKKGMVLNKTNANAIAAMYGDDTDGWIGKPIMLITAWVEFKGDTVQAIRVRRPEAAAPTVPVPATPPPNTVGMHTEAPLPAGPPPGMEPAAPAAGRGGTPFDDEIPPMGENADTSDIPF